ncbi:acyl-CoA thioesterase [Salininema proteolyticum]|uniref:Acyl-CoA thioesterase n=1 Tax=Salininema proteolyticum TaxID=1607685 RepID=A0ABV8U2F0_9ACTN
MNLYLRMLWLMLRSKSRGRLGVWDTARTPFRVAPTDLDVLRHMNNGKYLTLMDLGRVDLMVRSGFAKKVSAAGWYPVVAAQTISYRRSLKLWQRFELYSRVLGVDEKSTYLEQTFCVGETVYAKAVVRARFLKKSGGTVSQEELEELIGGVPESVRLPDWVRDWSENASVRSTAQV